MVGIGTKLTLEEFLALPDGDVYYEFVDGEAVPKVSPKKFIPVYRELYVASAMIHLSVLIAVLTLL
ncbi:hypothetical protein [Microcoleus sp. PH2017_02_FOX_O_A]|jgi:hypothetical protein|uniref:hypothetical protein n=1 Tax=unclassified Microcoleus TaxID=2642155 RepID=UPI001D4C6612|nr:hypothetical protein [Microcoleus sp. PH2017_02_FOX_O_A]MCC3431336.1 hypothetical protein [Microcoleus sp. PH2017_04_SCI_O_A]MCC3437354.1 hypothetical protein [Microcoleus sp. PH2017_05_CCC_O_A]MCC3469928.1 hypothetical protein [Microcoleus sp. PH2017_06_SFM_O_A]MCC3518782.1 hypothetical protein [Microcoleus sp. PH2017_18_LLB_O_A]MCC3572967.1 hypothetical protein [Microcoleus sp. PH2017_34_RAT_O_A]MCC3585762.1 hypothetical protein [Microcoleus sp. PH2017_30_WIL_O_A]MCC3609005.1 hypothetic